jgi:hypothetical protein
VIPLRRCVLREEVRKRFGAGSTLRSSRRRPSGFVPTMPDILSQALAPLQSFTSTSPQITVATRWHPAFAPSEVSSPSAPVSHEEPLTPVGSQPAGYVAPSGSLTLSTPCSLRDLPGLFHPGYAHGVNPTRPSSSHGAVRPLERRAPRGLPPPQQTAKLPTGTHTPQKTRRQSWGLASRLTRVPPWACPLRGLLPIADGGTNKSSPSPLALP